jgi:hypothetical protein
MNKGDEDKECRDTRWHWSKEDDELLEFILLMTEGENFDSSSS